MTPRPRSVRPRISAAILPVFLAASCAIAPQSEPLSDADVVPDQESDAERRIGLSVTGAPWIPSVDSRELTGESTATLRPPEGSESGDVVVAPIPFVNPTIGAGLALGGAYLIKLDPDSPPSVFGGGALYSENDSLAAAVGFKGYFGGDRYRVTAGVGQARLNFGLDVSGVEVPLQEEILGGTLEVLVRAFEHVYVGPTVVLFGIETSFRRDQDEGQIDDDELDTDNYGLGLHALRDTRDSTFYPRSGSLADVQFRTFVPALGTDFSYRILPLAYNHYLSLNGDLVLALRASGRFAIGDVPFYGQSYLGAGPDLRGYEVGTIRDDILLATQAELRYELGWRIGVVGFAGVGTVLPDIDEWDDAEAFPSLGLGLRFLLEEENHVNLRIDAAWGDGQDAIYVGVGEAF